MNLSRKLPLLTTGLVVVLCVALATAAIVGANRMMDTAHHQVDQSLSEMVADQMRQGAEREREQVLNLIDTARRQVVATARSGSALLALRADQDEQLRAIQSIVASTLELGRAAQGQIDQLARSLETSLTVIRHQMEQGGAWSTVGDAVDWQITDQRGEAATVALRPLSLSSTPIPITDDPAVAVPLLDGPARLSGALVTIFQRADDDRMVRIATTVTRQGKRAIRTAIAPNEKNGKPNAVLAEVLAGRPYRGLAWVVDRWCITAYQPIVVDGKVIGMLFAGAPVLELPGLVESIRRQRYGAGGYAVLVDAAGRLVTHPKAELVGKHLLDDLRIEGLKPMLTAPADGTVGTCWYAFEGRAKFGCYYKIPTWQWTVLATGYVDEIGADLIAQARTAMTGELELLYRTTQMAGSLGDTSGEAALFSQIRLLDREGRELINIREGKRVESTRTVKAPWFSAALADQTDAGLIHPLEVSVNTKRPELRLTVPLRHGNEVAGVLAVNLEWSMVQRSIGGHRYGKTGYPWIVNQDGVLVTHPKFSLSDHKSLVSPEMGELGEHVRQVLATGEPWQGFYAFEGVRKFSAMLPIQAGAQRWVIATTGPESELLEAAHAMDTEIAKGRRTLIGILLVVSLVVAVAGIASAMWYVRRLIAPIRRTELVLAGLGQGDLSGRLALTSNDEFGRMARALDGGLGTLGNTLGGVGRNAQSIAGAAEQLTAVSTQLTGNATTVAAQASQAAAAVTQVSTSIQTCASGIEQMTASVSEIAQSAGQAAAVAQEGVAAVREADATMVRLGTSSAEIRDIITLITGIAEQTNLLALNATIEAASAGEAGRGFAVVAGEVKGLARQTAAASADIGTRVTAILGDATAAQAALRRISGIVEKINVLQGSIAAAVEQQSATTKEIGGNLSQVSQAGADITKNVTAVADAANASSTGAAETLKAATELSRLANELRAEIGRFKI